MKNNNKFKVYYSSFIMTNEIEDYFIKLASLIKLNNLLSKNMITKSEYEKIKESLNILHPKSF